jgi:hypothetical protein
MEHYCHHCGRFGLLDAYSRLCDPCTSAWASRTAARREAVRHSYGITLTGPIGVGP